MTLQDITGTYQYTGRIITYIYDNNMNIIFNCNTMTNEIKTTITQVIQIWYSLLYISGVVLSKIK